MGPPASTRTLIWHPHRLFPNMAGDLAMTGELSLTGRVLPIGGVKEKLIAARRAGVKHVIFPKANEADYAELPEILKQEVVAHFAQTYDDVYAIAFAEDSELPTGATSTAD